VANPSNPFTFAPHIDTGWNGSRIQLFFTGQHWSTDEDYEPGYLRHEGEDEAHNSDEGFQEAYQDQEDQEDQEDQAHHLEYEDGSQGDVEGGDEDEGEYDEDAAPDLERGQYSPNSMSH
jgi:hypothetical protein